MILPLWNPEEAPVLDSLKAAKQSIGFEDMIFPRRVIDIDSDYSHERILAVGTRPDWLCDYALISARTSPAGWAAALHWVLSGEDHPKATLIIDTLRSIFGPDLHEISAEELLAEQKMRDYRLGV